jgi:type IX secretion system PorP/SprF family membrane protein
MHTQGIMQPEFLNPAYNSFKDYVSLGIYNRAQWGNQFKYSPETYVANLYLPISKARLGTNIGVIVEDIGLRTTTEFKLSLSHNVRLSEHGFLSFGYSVGFLQNSLDRKKIIAYSDEDLSYWLSKNDLQSIHPTISLGILYLSQRWYAGISSMTTSVKKNMDDSQYLPGFDFTGGAKLRLSSFLHFLPGVVIKYYNEKAIRSENGVLVKNKIPVVYDFAANFLVANKFLVGTSHRINQVQSFSLDMIIARNLKMGYTFELGIGKGLNQFDSHGLRLSYSFRNKKDVNPKNVLDIWPGNNPVTDEKPDAEKPEEISAPIN